MKFVIVTNNPKVRDELGQEFDVDYADLTYREILCKVRDMIYDCLLYTSNICSRMSSCQLR